MSGRFAANLRRPRDVAGLSQEELAFRAAIHRTQISLLEGGGRMPRVFTLVCLFLRKSIAAIIPGATGWTQAMRASLPKGKAVSAMVELRDGRKLAGVVASFTSAEKENRELVLRRPIKASGGPGRGEVELSADFITLREEQIALLSGRYVNTER